MLSTFACRQKIVPPHSFWRMCWSQSRRENHQKVSCASKSVLALLVLAGDIELNPGPLRNASSLPPLTGCLTLPSRECRIKGFSIIHLNARSLYSHLNGLVAFILPRVPDVVAVGETWLDESISSVHLTNPGYQLFRQDRNRHGGGGGVYVSESLVTKVCSCACNTSGLEYICLEISGIHLLSPVYLACLYRPPSAPTSSVTKLCIDVFSDRHPFSRLLLDFISNHSLQQPITSPTHVSSTSASVLDLFLISPNTPI